MLRRTVLSSVAIGLALFVLPAFAAKPQPIPIGDASAPPPSSRAGAITGNPPVCGMGVLGPPANAYGYILPPDDGYYTLLDPGNCPVCPQNGYRLTAAHMTLYFTAPCEIPVTVSVVPATEIAPACWGPSPFAPPICPPVQYVISDQAGQLNQCIDYTLPLPDGCCIDGPAFLVIEFDQGSCPVGRPAFCGPSLCGQCAQYNFYPGVTVPGDDLCALLQQFGLTGNIMYADAECCSATPTIPGSWGTIKVRYR
jgi:hypothetical protein